MTIPSGARLLIENEGRLFRETLVPGIYTVESDGQRVEHALNLSPRESTSSKYEKEELSSLGVELGLHDSQSVEAEVLQRQADLDIENQQKAWKWILCIAVGILLVETMLAARTQMRSVTRTAAT